MELLKPQEVDMIFRWGRGKARVLAKQGTLPAIVLPDGSIRFRQDQILGMIHPDAAVRIAKERDEKQQP